MLFARLSLRAQEYENSRQNHRGYAALIQKLIQNHVVFLA